MVKTPVSLEIFKSNPNPKSQARCLISFRMKKLKDQHIKIIRNFPKFVESRFTPISKIFSLMLKEGVDSIRKPFEGMNDLSVKDKSLLFNTDLVESLEFDNLDRKLSSMHIEYIRSNRPTSIYLVVIG